MPIYPHSKPGRWRVQLSINGNPKEWVIRGTRADAQAFEARQRVALEAGTLTTRISPSFGAFSAEVYKPHALQHLGYATWHKVRVYQVETLCGFFGNHRLTEITPDAVEQYKRKRGRKVKPSAINNELRVLGTILRWAAEMGYPAAPVKWRRVPIRVHPRVQVWTPRQIQALLFAAPEDLRPMLTFLANTGCRKGEAIACEWSWIDMPNAMVRIPSNEFWQPKNGMPREVPISATLARVLAGERRHPRWVFPTLGGGFGRNAIVARYQEFPKDRFNAARESAGLSGGPHTLRHSFASAFLANVPDMFLLAAVLGHSHTRVTELYSHLLPDHMARARGAVDIGIGDEVETEGRVVH